MYLELGVICKKSGPALVSWNNGLGFFLQQQHIAKGEKAE